MRHISPKEMEEMVAGIPLARIILRRPPQGSGAFLEFVAKSGEEIMISEPGTPDPVTFSSSETMEFFRKLGLFEGTHDEVILDALHYRPPGFGFMQRGAMRFGELRGLGGPDALGIVPETPASPAGEEAPKAEKPDESRFRTTIYVLNDQAQPEEFSLDEYIRQHEENAEEPEEEPELKIGEKYLTTINLIRLTAVVVTLELAMVLFLPTVWAVRDTVYMCAGGLVILALSFIFFERRRPDHPSLRVRRYIWLCLVLFSFSMTLSYAIGTRLFGIG